jgi:hypothetical protein
MNYRLNLGQDLGEYGDVLYQAQMGFKTQQTWTNLAQ